MADCNVANANHLHLRDFLLHRSNSLHIPLTLEPHTQWQKLDGLSFDFHIQIESGGQLLRGFVLLTKMPMSQSPKVMHVLAHQDVECSWLFTNGVKQSQPSGRGKLTSH